MSSNSPSSAPVDPARGDGWHPVRGEFQFAFSSRAKEAIKAALAMVIVYGIARRRGRRIDVDRPVRAGAVVVHACAFGVPRFLHLRGLSGDPAPPYGRLLPGLQVVYSEVDALLAQIERMLAGQEPTGKPSAFSSCRLHGSNLAPRSHCLFQ